VVDVLQEVIQELLQSEYAAANGLIAECTVDARLRNAAVFASTEECVCMRNQPLLVYRFVNYLRRTQRA